MSDWKPIQKKKVTAAARHHGSQHWFFSSTQYEHAQSFHQRAHSEHASEGILK